MSPKYIAIEGNIGAGKTTLSKLLAKQLNARLVLEEFEENPFLSKFYKDPKRYAFSVEMAFLADRYHQLNQIQLTEDLFQPMVISDYAPFKSLIFAQNNLSEEEFNLYREFWKMALGKLRQPDLILYLNRPLDSLQQNIRKRGRDYEMNLESSYLEKLSERYAFYLKNQWSGKLIYIDADEWDFIGNPKSLEAFVLRYLTDIR